MTKNANAEAIRAAVGALNAGDIDTYMAGFTDDCLHWLPGAADPVDLAAIRSSLEMLRGTFSGFRLDEMLIFGEGRHVCARWCMVGTHTGDQLGIPPTQRDVAVETVEIYEFERNDGGLVRASWTYGDPSTLMQQLGLADAATGQ